MQRPPGCWHATLLRIFFRFHLYPRRRPGFGYGTSHVLFFHQRCQRNSQRCFERQWQRLCLWSRRWRWRRRCLCLRLRVRLNHLRRRRLRRRRLRRRRPPAPSPSSVPLCEPLAASGPLRAFSALLACCFDAPCCFCTSSDFFTTTAGLDLLTPAPSPS